MTTGKSRSIGLLVAYLDNQFYPVALERLSAALQERGYHILVFMAKNSTDSVEEIVQELLNYQVDGIVAASVAVNGDLVERCADAGIPVVLFNRGQDGSGLSTVTSANFDGDRKVADFLAAGGQKRVAQIAGWSGSSTGRARQRGLVEGLAVHGLEPTHLIDGMYSRDTAAEAARLTWRP